MSVSVPTLLTVDQLVQRHPAFTAGGIRWLLFRRDENGLDRAVIRVGRRLLIDEAAFFDWISEINGQTNEI